MRMGKFVISFKFPITTNILSHFPTGYITFYTYATRIMDILFGIINIPVLRVFFIKFSDSIAKIDFKNIKKNLETVIKTNEIVFFYSILLAIVFFKKIFTILFYPKVSLEYISIMYYIFLSLIPFYVIALIEAPFVNIIEAIKKGKKILFVASINLILYVLLLISSIKYLKIYSLPFSLFFSQIYNTFSFINYTNMKFEIVNSKILKFIFKYASSFIIMISLNFLLGFLKSFIPSLFFNICFLLFLIILFKNEIYLTKSIMFKKGEIK